MQGNPLQLGEGEECIIFVGIIDILQVLHGRFHTCIWRNRFCAKLCCWRVVTRVMEVQQAQCLFPAQKSRLFVVLTHKRFLPASR